MGIRAISLCSFELGLTRNPSKIQTKLCSFREIMAWTFEIQNAKVGGQILNSHVKISQGDNDQLLRQKIISVNCLVPKSSCTNYCFCLLDE